MFRHPKKFNINIIVYFGSSLKYETPSELTFSTFSSNVKQKNKNVYIIKTCCVNLLIGKYWNK